MTTAERREAAEEYIRRRNGTIDQWHSPERGCLMYGVSFSVWDGKRYLDGKLMKTGTDLVEVVDALREQEQQALKEGAIPKPAPPPQPPSPVITPTYATCLGCGASVTPGSYCPLCGMFVS